MALRKGLASCADSKKDLGVTYGPRKGNAVWRFAAEVKAEWRVLIELWGGVYRNYRHLLIGSLINKDNL